MSNSREDDKLNIHKKIVDHPAWPMHIAPHIKAHGLLAHNREEEAFQTLLNSSTSSVRVPIKDHTGASYDDITGCMIAEIDFLDGGRKGKG